MNVRMKPETMALLLALASFCSLLYVPLKNLWKQATTTASSTCQWTNWPAAPKKNRYVDVLSQAFDRANDRDLAEAEALRRDNRPEHWDRILSLYQRVADRQNRVAPLMPLADKHGIGADVRFVQVEDLHPRCPQQCRRVPLQPRSGTHGTGSQRRPFCRPQCV